MTRAIAGAMAVLLLTACSDPSSSTGDRLSREEALLIADGVTNSAASASGNLRPSGSERETANAAPTTITVDHESNHPCPEGGRIGVTLEATFFLDVDEQTYSLDVAGALSHQSCAYVREGVTLTITGDPNLEYEAHAAVLNGQPDGQASAAASGAFNWTASDGRSGRCVVELSDVTEFAARRRTVEGEVCGHTVRRVTTWT